MGPRLGDFLVRAATAIVTQWLNTIGNAAIAGKHISQIYNKLCSAEYFDTLSNNLIRTYSA